MKFKYFYPTLTESWIIVLILTFVGSLFGGGVGLLLAGSPLSIVNSSITYLCTMIPPIWYCAARGKKLSFSVIDSPKYIKINQPNFGSFAAVPLFLLLAVAVLAIAIVVEPLTAWMEMPEYIRQLFEAAFDAQKPVDLIICTAILAPLCEEFLCRGNMLRGMLSYKSPIKAILWSGFIFALIHFNPWQSVPAFILGCFFGWIYYKTHSLWACIFMHFVNNATSAICTIAFPDLGMSDTLSSIVDKGTYAIIYFGALAILCGAIYLLNKKLNNNEETLSFKVQINTQE